MSGNLRFFIHAILGMMLALGSSLPVLAQSGYQSAFNNLYGAAGTVLDNCNICHTSGNPYYADFAAVPHTGTAAASAFRAIEPLDSDGDGFTNMEEIAAGTFPGNASDRPAASTPATSPPAASAPPPAATPPTSPPQTSPTGGPVTVLNPNGGELVPSGSICTINWNAAPEAANFTLGYSTDNGRTWKLIDSGVTGTSYDWQVPVPYGNRNTLVKVIAYTADNEFLGRDISDLPFLMEVVRMSDFGENAILIPGTPVILSWALNATPKPVDRIILRLTLDGGLSWETVATLPGDRLSYEWTVPWVDAEKAGSGLKVILKDAEDRSVGSAAGGTFTIIP